MAFRLRSLVAICACAVLFRVPGLAQSNPVFRTDPTSLLGIVQQSDLARPQTPSFATQSLPTHRRSAATTRLATPGSSGLSFEPVVSYSSGGDGGNSIAIADLNGDGYPDLIVASYCATGSGCANGSVAVLMGGVGGTFGAPTSYASGGQFADSVAVADLGNGNLDLIVGNCSSFANNVCAGTTGGVSILRGDGKGGFATAVPYATAFGVAAVAVADVNGDGKKDVLIATNCGSGSPITYSGCVGVLLGDGTGNLATAVTYQSGGYSPGAIAVGDVNGDGKLDVVVAHCGTQTDGTCGAGNVGVLVGNGDGSFVSGVIYDSAGVYPDGVAISDVNGDGKPDVVVANSSVSVSDPSGNLGVLLGNGDGTLQIAVAYGSGGFGASSVAVLDVNGDSKPDIVVANCSASTGACTDNTSGTVGVGVLLGNGDGTFQAAVTYAAGGNTPFGIAVADLNGDSKPDIAVANCAGANCGTAGVGSVGVLLNSSLGGTTTKLTSSANPSQPAQAVTFTATVTSGFTGTPTGTVNFLNGTTSLGSPTLSSGVASVTVSTLPAGSASITANYSGDTNFVTSTSGVLTQQVGGVSTTTLTLSSGTVAFGASVTLTAKVTSTGVAPADGEIVTFQDATTNTALGTAKLASGTATFTSTTIPAGTYSVVASYPGDANTLASVSSAQPLNIQNFTLAATPTTVTVSAPGQPGTATITVTTYGGLSASSVGGWTCSGLPALSTCAFGTLNSSNQVTVTISTTASSDLHWPALGHPQGLFYALWLPGFLGVVFMAGHRRKSRALQLLALFAVLSLTTLWVACGSSSSTTSKQGTPPGTFTFTVSATSGTLQAKTTVTLTVQ